MTAAPTADRRTRLDERLRGYHAGKGLTEMLELLDYLREPGDTVIAGGSLSIGLGNVLSDLDVVLVGDTTRTSAVPLQHWIDRGESARTIGEPKDRKGSPAAGSLRIDVWTRSTANVDELFTEAEEALASPTPLLRVFGNTEQEQQLKLLHRIAFGVLVDGEPVQPNTPSSRTPQQIAVDLLTREYAERLRESATIARLAASAGRLLTASFSARQALEEALHAVLHAGGVPFSGDKWLQEQLRPFPELLALHTRFLDVPRRSTGAAEVHSYVDAALADAEDLLGLSLSPADLTFGLQWKAPALTLLPLAGQHLLVDATAGTSWELDDEDAAAWEPLASGRASDGLIPHPEGPAGAAALAVRLHEQGLFTPTWQHGVPITALTINPEALR